MCSDGLCRITQILTQTVLKCVMCNEREELLKKGRQRTSNPGGLYRAGIQQSLSSSASVDEGFENVPVRKARFPVSGASPSVFLTLFTFTSSCRGMGRAYGMGEASDETGFPVISLPRRTNSVNAPIHIHKLCMGDRQERWAMHISAHVGA